MPFQLGPTFTNVIHEKDLSNLQAYDVLLYILPHGYKSEIVEVQECIEAALRWDPSFESEKAVLLQLARLKNAENVRLVVSPTGLFDPDYDDVRVFKRAAMCAIQKVLKAKFERPLLILGNYSSYFVNADMMTILGALEAMYVPIQIRDVHPGCAPTQSGDAGNNTCGLHMIKSLGVYSTLGEEASKMIECADKLERGRRVCCDIGDADPERMTPRRIQAYVEHTFKDFPAIRITTISSVKDLQREYPLFEAVNRAASTVERHQGRIMFLEYLTPNVRDEDIKETLFLVGKGVTYDTGGMDIKVGGYMIGMSRDKCGAAAALGFMYLTALFEPKHLQVFVGTPLVRNSVGPEGYVADELITARSGARVRVVNTDAEGRMVMADVLCKYKEFAMRTKNPHLYTIATLTGHARRTVGKGYSIVLDNGPAKRGKNAEKLQASGDLVGDIFEISRIRREDFDAHKGEAIGDGVKQMSMGTSSQSARGHQAPAAFLMMASGLDKHGSRSEYPLKFTHLDIAASAGQFPKPATGAAVHALAQRYILSEMFGQ